jgi:hypothetical protein
VGLRLSKGLVNQKAERHFRAHRFERLDKQQRRQREAPSTWDREASIALESGDTKRLVARMPVGDACRDQPLPYCASNNNEA